MCLRALADSLCVVAKGPVLVELLASRGCASVTGALARLLEERGGAIGSAKGHRQTGRTRHMRGNGADRGAGKD